SRPYRAPAREGATTGPDAPARGRGAPPLGLRTGAGKSAKLTWDEKQTQLAFLGEPGDPAAGKGFRLYRWDRSAAAADAARDGPELVRILMAGPLPVLAGALRKWAEPRLRPGQWPQVVELAAAGTPGLRPGMAVSEHAALAFSPDGGRLFFGVAPPEEKEKAKAEEPEKAIVELWHWKDDFVQPMQKVKALREQKRSFR